MLSTVRYNRGCRKGVTPCTAFSAAANREAFRSAGEQPVVHGSILSWKGPPIFLGLRLGSLASSTALDGFSDVANKVLDSSRGSLLGRSRFLRAWKRSGLHF
jgi:hypothetical protein